MELKAAWILNNYPETRDSDIKLQLAYWREFEGYNGGAIYPEDLFRLTRLTSLARARATLQNDFRLFVASPEIRKRRGKLSEEERQKALEQVPPHPLITIYADESGKQGEHLIWGSVWFLHAPDTLRLTRVMANWREATGFDKEFHFKDLDREVLGAYVEAVRLVLAQVPALSFKAITHPRRGLGRPDEALESMLYFLIKRGVEHEHSTGRAPLPRSVQLWKDLEDKSRDDLLLAKLQEDLAQAAVTVFDKRLRVDEFFVLSSETQVLLQLADLFAGSLNRVLNNPGAGPKDDFASFFLDAVGMPGGPAAAEAAHGLPDFRPPLDQAIEHRPTSNDRLRPDRADRRPSRNADGRGDPKAPAMESSTRRLHRQWRPYAGYRYPYPIQPRARRQVQPPRIVVAPGEVRVVLRRLDPAERLALG
jgi:hypothetical protein